MQCILYYKCTNISLLLLLSLSLLVLLIYIYICICICIHITHTHTYTLYIYIHMYMYVCVYIYIYIYMPPSVLIVYSLLIWTLLLKLHADVNILNIFASTALSFFLCISLFRFDTSSYHRSSDLFYVFFLQSLSQFQRWQSTSATSLQLYYFKVGHTHPQYLCNFSSVSTSKQTSAISLPPLGAARACCTILHCVLQSDVLWIYIYIYIYILWYAVILVYIILHCIVLFVYYIVPYDITLSLSISLSI